MSSMLALLGALSTPLALGLIGLAVGSFINVVVLRWPRIMERQWWGDVAQQLQDDDSVERVWGSDARAHSLAVQGLTLQDRLQRLPLLSLSRPGSHCPACGHALRWTELIPVWSWLWLRGRCSACAAPISPRYPLVELGTCALFITMGWRWEQAPIALLWCGWAAALLALALIDWDTLLLPDGLTLPLVWVGLGAAACGWTIEPTQAIAGALVGWGSLWAVATGFRLLTGREGMGAGDFKLLAALGAWLGPMMLVPVVLLASLAGALVGLVMKGRGELREGRYVPFGPFLAGAGLAVSLAGSEQVLRWWGWP